MKNYKTILTEKEQKILSVSSGKIDKYEYITGKEILPSDHSRIIGQANSTYSPHGKAFEEQIKTIEDQGIKQAEALGRKMGKKIKRKETEYYNETMWKKIHIWFLAISNNKIFWW